MLPIPLSPSQDATGEGEREEKEVGLTEQMLDSISYPLNFKGSLFSVGRPDLPQKKEWPFKIQREGDATKQLFRENSFFCLPPALLAPGKQKGQV